MIKIPDDRIIEVTNRSLTMARAAAELGLHFNTFKVHAVRLGVYKPNPAGKGITRNCESRSIPLQEILDGKQPQYQTYKLKLKLFKKKIFENKCLKCGSEEWLGQPLKCELNHIDGDKHNHKLDNLEILCPNCHSQTSTFRAKNIGRMAKR